MDFSIDADAILTEIESVYGSLTNVDVNELSNVFEEIMGQLVDEQTSQAYRDSVQQAFDYVLYEVQQHEAM